MTSLKKMMLSMCALILAVLGPIAPASAIDLTPILETSVKVLDIKGGAGSGTIVHSECYRGSYQTYVLTNDHVVNGTTGGDVLLHRYTDDRWPDLYKGKVVARAWNKDLALIRVIHDKKLPGPLPTATIHTEETKMGTRVYVVGFPSGDGPVLTEGYLSRKGFFMDGYLKQYLTSAPINYGNSGGGLFKETPTGMELIGAIHAVNGRMVDVRHPTGMGNPLGAFFLPVNHLSYAVPNDLILKFLKQKNMLWILDKEGDHSC